MSEDKHADCPPCCYQSPDFIRVPDEGEWFVRDGVVVPVQEIELKEPDDEGWEWRMWTERPPWAD